jgi:L-2-hydroxyglutarate oxidase LhgO
MQRFDVIIIGGGIVGLATAYQLQRRFPNLSLLLVEKESQVAAHQTGHNSGVLHSGIYYKPGSSKARNCRDGKVAMQNFCQEHSIPYEICGKVIVATESRELPWLQNIFERGQANGVQCELIGPERLKELEPHAAGIQAIHVPEAGIVNYRAVSEKLAALVESASGQVRLGCRVNGIRVSADESIIESTAGEFATPTIVACAGLHSDRVAHWSGNDPGAKIVPFRGEYYEVISEKRYLCRNLIYPVPDPRFVFLGVHFTRMIDGGLECGPNAVLAFAREGYTMGTINWKDLWESLAYRGFRKLALRHWRMGMAEMWRSFSKAAFVKALQRLLPEIRSADLHPAPAGVRAQAVLPDGGFVDDFHIVESARAINIVNAPSPAATASLNIGQLIVDRMVARLSG